MAAAAIHTNRSRLARDRARHLRTNIWAWKTKLLTLFAPRAPHYKKQRTRNKPNAHLLAHMSGVAQWLTCWAHNPKVRGSKPRPAILHRTPELAVATTTEICQECPTQKQPRPPTGNGPSPFRNIWL